MSMSKLLPNPLEYSRADRNLPSSKQFQLYAQGNHSRLEHLQKTLVAKLIRQTMRMVGASTDINASQDSFLFHRNIILIIRKLQRTIKVLQSRQTDHSRIISYKLNQNSVSDEEYARTQVVPISTIHNEHNVKSRDDKACRKSRKYIEEVLLFMRERNVNLTQHL